MLQYNEIFVQHIDYLDKAHGDNIDNALTNTLLASWVGLVWIALLSGSYYYNYFTSDVHEPESKYDN